MNDLPPVPDISIAWEQSLARSRAQIAAGDSVPLLPILDRLRASAERLEVEQDLSPDGEKLSANP